VSYPILYSATETNYDNNGIGILSACVSCEVTEEANGAFELAMTYPMDGVHFAEIGDRAIIKAKADQFRDPQLFRVYAISRPMSGVVTVLAEHISYDLSGIPVKPFSANSASASLAGLKNNSVIDCPFEFWTDKDTVSKFSVTNPASIRSRLGGADGSILDVYGGEYEFDNYTVKLHNNRGENRGVSIRYGKNLTDIQQDQNCSSVATGIYPYWVDGDSDVLVELPEKIVNAPGTYNFTKIKTVDFSQEFESQPTDEQLRIRAEKYIADNDIGIPKVSMTVSFAQLEQYEEYKNLKLLERVSLFDTVNVEFPALRVSATAKAVKMAYDVLADRVKSVTLGSVRANIADTIVEQQKEMEKAPTKTDLERAKDAATSWLTNGKGYAYFRKDDSGNIVDILFMDTQSPATAVNVMRVGQSGIGFSQNGVNGQYESAWTIDGKFVADFITAGTLNAALLDVINLSANSITAGTLASTDGKSVVIDLDEGTADIVGNVTTRTIGDGEGGVYVASLSPNGLSIGMDDAPINTHLWRNRLQFVGNYGDVIIQNALNNFNGSLISLADRSLNSRVRISASPEGSTDPGGQIILSAEDAYNSNGLIIKCDPSQSYISGLTTPTYPSSAVNKEYVDGKISALAPNGIIPVANGGTGGTTVATAQAALHVNQDFLFSQLNAAGDKTLDGIDAYPTKPGVYRVTTGSASIGIPGDYGCLAIFNGGGYYMHLYVNADGFWTARTTSMTAPTWKKMAVAT
jgi:phage minor structural protein